MLVLLVFLGLISWTFPNTMFASAYKRLLNYLWMLVKRVGIFVWRKILWPLIKGIVIKWPLFVLERFFIFVWKITKRFFITIAPFFRWLFRPFFNCLTRVWEFVVDIVNDITPTYLLHNTFDVLYRWCFYPISVVFRWPYYVVVSFLRFLKEIFLKLVRLIRNPDS